MAYTKICVAAALAAISRYHADRGPNSRSRGRAGAQAYGVPVSVLSVEAPVELLPDVETMEEKIERYAEPLKAEGLEVDAAIRKGKPSREIIAHMEEIGADVLIIGSHSKRGPLDVGLGSTAAALLRDTRNDGDHGAADRGGAGEGARADDPALPDGLPVRLIRAGTTEYVGMHIDSYSFGQYPDRWKGLFDGRYPAGWRCERVPGGERRGDTSTRWRISRSWWPLRPKW